MSINLYAKGGSVAGIADWGDGIHVVFDEESWAKLCVVLERLSPMPPYDVAEAINRSTVPSK